MGTSLDHMIRKVLAQVSEIAGLQQWMQGPFSKQICAVSNTRLIFCIYWRCRALIS
jgi:hypothetical protein